jgi:hypothetical protein
MRTFSLALIAMLATACVASSKADAPVRNFVCERIADEEPAAKCRPEFTDAGEQHTHSAVVTTDKGRASCVLNASSVSVVCGPLVVVPQPAEAKK